MAQLITFVEACIPDSDISVLEKALIIHYEYMDATLSRVWLSQTIHGNIRHSPAEYQEQTSSGSSNQHRNNKGLFRKAAVAEGHTIERNDKARVHSVCRPVIGS